MKLRFTLHSTIVAALLIFVIPPLSAIASVDGGSVRVGYVLADEEGSLAVNQSTFNTYEGAALSFENIRLSFKNGTYLTANLQDVTLNNRNLVLRVNKPGLFSVSVLNNQYRRTYNSEGSDFTRRRTTGSNLWIRPSRYLKLFGNYTLTEKKGTNFLVRPEMTDTLRFSSDYSQTSYSLGASATSHKGSARVEYRHQKFEDDANILNDRNADILRFSATIQPPRYDWLMLSGGYLNRKDKLTSSSIELKLNQGWIGMRLFLPRKIAVDYRFSLAQSDNSSTGVQTDNTFHTLSLGKSWRGRAGLRLGYENRAADDEADRTVSQGFFTNGWLKWNTRLMIRGSYGTRNEDVENGSTLIGDRTETRHNLSVTYRQSSWATISGQWQGRISEHEADLALRNSPGFNSAIGSKVDYNRWTARLKLERPKYGSINLSHSYYLGQFENNSDNVNYEFSDHLFRAELTPRSYKGLEIHLKGSYYSSRRDHDIEKIDLGFAGSYSVANGYTLEVKYDAITYDDFLFTDNYYIGNIVRVSLRKDL